MLDETQEKLQLITMALDASNQGWWVYRPFQREITLSEGARLLLGYKENLDSEAWISLIHPKDMEKTKAIFDGFRYEGQQEYSQALRLKTFQRGYVWFEMKGRLFEGDGNQENMRVVGVLMDISEKKEVEERLENLRSENEMMLDAAGEAIFRIASSGQVMYLNQSARRIFRLQSSQKRTRLKLDGILGNEQGRPPYQNTSQKSGGIYETIKQGISKQVSYEIFHRPDGTSFPVEYISNPVKATESEPFDVVVTFRDITDRQKAKDAERKLLRHVNEQMQELTCLYKITRLTLDTSKKMGHVLSEMTRLLPEARMDTNSSYARISFRRKVYQSPQFHETGVHQAVPITVGGRTIGKVELFFSNPVLQQWESTSTHDTAKLLDAVSNSISTFYKRKTAEEGRKESNRKFATLLSNLPGMVFRLQKEQFRFVSQGSMQLTGYSPEAFLKDGNQVNRNSLVHPEDYPGLQQLCEVALQKKESYQATYRMFTADKQLKWVWEQGIGVGNTEEGLLMIEGFMLDITEQKKAEASLIDSYKERHNLIITQNARLENKVKDRTKALEESHEQLQKAYEKLKSTQSKLVASEKMASLGQLTAGIAHEINNPVNFIGASSGALQELLGDILALLNEYDQLNLDNYPVQRERIEQLKKELMLEGVEKDIREMMQNIENGVSRTAEIVKELRTFSRVDEAAKKMVDIHAGIRSILVIMRSQYKNDVAVQMDFGDLPQVECFPGKINQVVMNILQNAIQSTLERKAAVDQKDYSPQVTIKTYLERGDEEKEWACIEISDNGQGVSASLLGRIFDPFFTTKDVGKGVGLGLSISMSIAEQHGGTIRVSDHPGGGAVFVIYLPI